jgi:hypothetical protein
VVDPVPYVPDAQVEVPALLLNIVQSAELRYPFTDVVATGILTVFPDGARGEVKDRVLCLLLKVDQSVEDSNPLLDALAVGILNVC